MVAPKTASIILRGIHKHIQTKGNNCPTLTCLDQAPLGIQLPRQQENRKPNPMKNDRLYLACTIRKPAQTVGNTKAHFEYL